MQNYERMFKCWKFIITHEKIILNKWKRVSIIENLVLNN